MKSPRLDLSRFAGDARLARALLREINRRLDRKLNLMEVCGTHTMAISASGLRKAIDSRLGLLSGPGCPVCVTAQEDLDLALELCREPGVTVTTFGDMLRVPGSSTSLEQQVALGRDVRIVYSPLDALKLACQQPRRQVVFLGVGFETTAPTIAAALKLARTQGRDNFLVLSLCKTMPQALRTIAQAPGLKIDGFILPGHVSTIIGSGPYEFLVEEFHKSCCIVGFELLDLLQGILMLVNQARNSTPRAVEIQYRRSVKPAGNRAAQKLIAEVFEPCAANWRGLGTIPESGLALRSDYSRHDARRRYGLAPAPSRPIPGCRCGDVLLGIIRPPECRQFGRRCRPESPLGPCMVSSEGACAAYYKYEQ